jgi:hypothetical protein
MSREMFFPNELQEKKIENFFNKTFEQTKQQPLRYAKKNGSFMYPYNEIFLDHRKDLQKIDPSLSEGVLFLPPAALPIDFNDNSRQTFHISVLRASYQKKIEQLTQNHILPQLMDQVIESDILTLPSSYAMQRGRSCYLSAYKTVFKEITGTSVNEHTILSAAKNQNLVKRNNFGSMDHQIDGTNYRDVEEHTLLTSLQTPVFRETFGDIQVGVVKFTGADFNDITKVVKKIKNKMSDKEVSSFFIPFYDSERVIHGWHNGLLLSADQQTVHIREPYTSFERPQDRKFTKEAFIHKWAKAHLRGDLIFAIKPRESN